MSDSLTTDDVHEFGDSWYKFTSPGKAYIFLKATDMQAGATFSFGYSPMFPKWALYLCAGIGGFFALVCLFICFCYVRRIA
jgi:hypothetical protein